MWPSNSIVSLKLVLPKMMKEEELNTYIEASHQRATEMSWLHFGVRLSCSLSLWIANINLQTL